MVEIQGNEERLRRRLQWFLFAAALVAFAYFHQGGGWNQNGRFAMVRAVVEEGKFAIDSYLIYVADDAAAGTMRRAQIFDGEYQNEGRTFALIWADAKGRPVPINSKLEGIITAIDAKAGVLELLVGREARLQFGLTEGTRAMIGNVSAGLDGVAAGKVAQVEFSVDEEGKLTALNVVVLDLGSPRQLVFVDLGAVGATGDVAFDKGHFHPNKAPGTSFMAVPAYFVVYWVEKIFGVNPDSWRALTVNAWLTSVFSVGLLSAFGVVVFFRLAMLWSNRVMASLLAALAFAFGTMYFSYATMLYEHNIIAVLLLIAFYLIFKIRSVTAVVDPVTGETFSREWVWLLLAGLCAGYAAITNYIIAVVVIMLGAYALVAVKKKGSLFWFGVGLLGPFLLICAYNVICFDTPFTTNYRHQNPLFRSDAFMDVFLLPNFGILVSVLVSPFRGLFFSAPVLALGIFGLARMFKSQRLRAEAWLCSAVVAFFLAFIMCYNGWHGGWAAMPRYLLPALPFLALPMVGAFVRFQKTSIVIAVVSLAINLVTTAVDPQTPVGNGSPGSVPTRPAVGEKPFSASFAYNPLTEYELPFFLSGRPTPFLEAMVNGYAAQFHEVLVRNNLPRIVCKTLMEDVRENLKAFVIHLGSKSLESAPQPKFDEAALLSQFRAVVGQEEAARHLTGVLEFARSYLHQTKGALLPLASMEGHVSVNPMGIYEGWFYRLHRPPSEEFGPQSQQARGNSFNIGELLLEGNVVSLLPLLAACGVLIFLMLQLASQLQDGAEKKGKKAKK